jgi:putative serine protease PepD
MRQRAWIIGLAFAAALAGVAPGQERPPKVGIVPDYTDAGAAAGVLIAEVVADSPAAKAGLKAGDRITGLAGKPVKNIPENISVMKGLRKGDSAQVRFDRDGKELMVEVKLE